MKIYIMNNPFGFKMNSISVLFPQGSIYNQLAVQINIIFKNGNQRSNILLIHVRNYSAIVRDQSSKDVSPLM